MFRTIRPVLLLACVLLAAIATPVFAENEGQEDLDKATQLKVTAESLDDLNEVVDHADSALEKGLDAENKKFAEQLLISSLIQRGQLYSAAVFNVPAQDPQRAMRSMQFRQFALSDLQRVVGLDSKAVDAQLLIGKLQSLPLGDDSAARKALSKVVNAEDATPEQKAEAYALRSSVEKDDKKKAEDLDEAIKLQPEKAEFLRMRSQNLFEKDKFDDALADADKALKIDPDHAATNELRGMILLGANKYEDALKSFDRASELVPEAPLPYQHRGELYRQKGDLNKALEQLSKALELQPDNIAALMVRANLYYELKQPDKAIDDIDRAIKLQPTLAQPHLMKAEILASSNRIDQAISQLEKLLQAAPGNELLLNRLSTFYLLANRPRKAIEAASQILKAEPDNYSALRFRGDAYLNIGKHAEAVADFDKAVALKEDDESLLNNFAWVLATSPDDKLRDGARALKLATKAAESSGYETPHILSTLAAAYAETGDFENAAKWSEKSVELSQKDVEAAKANLEKADANADPDALKKDLTKIEDDHNQLKKELDNYHDHKPTRERQTAEDAPEAPPKADHASTPANPQLPNQGESF